MRSKAPLAMMEQMVMLLVFALAAALCLQAFVQSDAMSRKMEARDRAMTLCQTAAETLRSTGGDFEETARILGFENYDEDSLETDYQEDWLLSPTQSLTRYSLAARKKESNVPGLGKAEVWVKDWSIDSADDDLFRLEIAWQEVNVYG